MEYSLANYLYISIYTDDAKYHMSCVNWDAVVIFATCTLEISCYETRRYVSVIGYSIPTEINDISLSGRETYINALVD